MMPLLKQSLRGCRSLPHVGPHPGTAWLIGIVALSGAACLSGGFIRAMLAAVLSLLVFGPIYLHGGYMRAKASDNISRHESRTRG